MKKRATKKTTTRRTAFRSVEITIIGHDSGHLGDVLGHCITLAREGTSGTVKAAGITGTVKVTR